MVDPHCPHLGGATLGSVVQVANTSGRTPDRLSRQLDAARQSVSDLVAENEALKREIERFRLELKLERQYKFGTNRQRQSDVALAKISASPSDC
jgi:transposase